jgi:hypothetical protein
MKDENASYISRDIWNCLWYFKIVFIYLFIYLFILRFVVEHLKYLVEAWLGNCTKALDT